MKKFKVGDKVNVAKWGLGEVVVIYTHSLMILMDGEPTPTICNFDECEVVYES